MSRKCSVTGKGPMSGNNVSHANNRTRRRFEVNLRETSMLSELLGRMVRLRLSANGIRTIEHKGGLDAFMLGVKAAKLDKKASALKKTIVRRAQAVQATAPQQDPVA